MAKKLIEFMDTSFRDGFQSVFGARVATKDFLPPLEAAIEAGTSYFEAGGGARFQSLFFYCNRVFWHVGRHHVNAGYYCSFHIALYLSRDTDWNIDVPL